MKSAKRPPADTTGIVVRSDDGAVSFQLCQTPRGLLVQRERRRKERRARLVQTAVFRDAERFLRWCDADSVRFDYPMIFTALRREGESLLEMNYVDPPTRGHRERP